MYLDKVRQYLIALIDEKKISDQKIQLDIAINLRHIKNTIELLFMSNQRTSYAYHLIIQKIY